MSSWEIHEQQKTNRGRGNHEVCTYLSRDVGDDEDLAAVLAQALDEVASRCDSGPWATLDCVSRVGRGEVTLEPNRLTHCVGRARAACVTLWVGRFVESQDDPDDPDQVREFERVGRGHEAEVRSALLEAARRRPAIVCFPAFRVGDADEPSAWERIDWPRR